MSKPHNIMPEGVAAMNRYYSKYKYSAKERNIDFDLNKEYFELLVKERCFYCGCEPYRKYPLDIIKRRVNGCIIINGIDRKNPKLGYTVNNCVPCCGKCNLGKQQLTHDEFIKWIQDVYKYRCTDD